jgi:RNA polymerase sigma factor (sigma-70 family)
MKGLKSPQLDILPWRPVVTEVERAVLPHVGIAWKLARYYTRGSAGRGVEPEDLVNVGLQELTRQHLSGLLASSLERVRQKGVSALAYARGAMRSRMWRYLRRQDVFSAADAADDQEQAPDFQAIPDHREREGADPADRELVERLLGRLPQRERAVVAAYYGLDGEEEADTLKEVADRLGGVNKGWARRMLQRALKRMRTFAGVPEKAVAEKANEPSGAKEKTGADIFFAPN